MPLGVIPSEARLLRPECLCGTRCLRSGRVCGARNLLFTKCTKNSRFLVASGSSECHAAQSHSISMPFLDTRTFGGLCLVRMRMALNPPPRVRTAPLAISNPSLLVGSGSRMARIITAAPKMVMPPAIRTAAHSLRESPAFNPSSRSDWLPGSIPTFASSMRTTWSRLRYAFASRANHPCSEVRIVSSVASLPLTFVVTAAGWLFCISSEPFPFSLAYTRQEFYPPVDADLEFAGVMHSRLFQSSLLSPHAGCHHLSELLSNQKRLPLAEVAGYPERS